MDDTSRPPRYWTTEEVAERYRTTAGTVRYWRHIGFGPRGVKLGRRVLYPDDALLAFDAHLCSEADGEPAA